MRAIPWYAAVLIVGLHTIATAQIQTFPYEAVVATDGVPLHSGPGYYATSRLDKGDRVTVHRHDPGGWFMIAPPPGEFSLIVADAVRLTGPDSAEIVAEETTARIGSRLSNDHNVEQVPLVRGDRVRLVKNVTAPAGWVAIKPPRGEFRWVPGKFLVPVGDEVRLQQDADPFSLPSTAKRPEVLARDTIVSPSAVTDLQPERPMPLARNAPKSSPIESASKEPANDGRDVLRMLDRELEGLMLTEPTAWPLEELAAEYRRLKSTHAIPARQIDVRLAQIERMRMVRGHYTDYVQLTSATDERDAALVARSTASGAGADGIVHAAKPVPQDSPVRLAQPIPVENGTTNTAPRQPPMAPPAAPVPEEPVNRPIPANGAPHSAPPARMRTTPAQLSTESQPTSGPVLMAPDTSAATPAATTTPKRTVASARQPQRFDAVGTIQKTVNSHPDAPKHVLVAPSGAILVYLQSPPGVSLDQFVGQSMGVDGERLRHPELTPPMIVVERLTPVQN